MLRVYIFGAGANGLRAKALLEELGEEIEAFIDNSEQKIGNVIAGLRCISVSQAVAEGAQNALVFVSPKEAYEIRFQLEKEKFQHVAYCDFHSWSLPPKRYMNDDFCNVHPFDHFESPYPNICEIHEREAEIFDADKTVLDIDFNIQRQLELAGEMEKISLPGWKEKKSESRYYYGNGMFNKGSADTLYYMLRILKPRKIIEVGSGFSTAVMLDTNEEYFQNSIEIFSIEPYADRLKALLKEGDNLKLSECFLQDVPLDFFAQLEAGDILFIDSSHVSRINSDVNYLFFEIMPRLKKGVYIHFHDIFYPFIYPKKWVYEGRAYNEMYILRAFLMNNDKYTIQFFDGMLEKECGDKLCDKLKENCSGSIWIRKE